MLGAAGRRRVQAERPVRPRRAVLDLDAGGLDPVADCVGGGEVLVGAGPRRCSSSPVTSASTASAAASCETPHAQCGSSGSTPSTASIARTDAAAPRSAPESPSPRSLLPSRVTSWIAATAAGVPRSSSIACDEVGAGRPERDLAEHVSAARARNARSGRSPPPPRRAPRRRTRRASGSARPRCRSAGRSPGSARARRGWRALLPSDLLIFSPAVVIQALCIQSVANSCRPPGTGPAVLVVREAQVDAAAVDVEGSPRYFRAIAEHSMCQPGRPAPRRGPRRGLRLGRLVALPQGEVAWVPLAARVGVPAASISSTRCPESSPYAGQDSTSK